MPVRSSIEAEKTGGVLALKWEQFWGLGGQEMMVCLTESEWRRAQERWEMRSRGPGPHHAGLTGHGEEFGASNGKPLEGFRGVMTRI